MDAVREQLSKPLIAGIVGFVIGLILGWFVIGWGLWPVQYVGAGPKDLTYAEKVTYMRMAMQAYAQSADPAQAQATYNALGEDAPQVLQDIVNNPAGLSPNVIQAYGITVLGAPVAQTAPAGAPTPAGTIQAGPVITSTLPGAATPTETGGRSGGFLRSLLPILCLITLVLAAALIVVFVMRSRGATPGVRTTTPAMQAQQAARQAAYTDYAASGTEPPMAQFMASYKVGDDLFDDSFSIDSPAGEFMGECGVGISETIGVGDPKKVTAFEVWLFDKNDIQTVTKVLMSDHAYHDDATRQRLAAKGEPILVSPGVETVLETQTLQLVARVVDMGYGDGALPSQSYFDRFILELAVWPKNAA